MRSTTCAVFVMLGYLTSAEAYEPPHSEVPEPFRGFDASSTETIDYSALDQWLDFMVVDIGRSDRRSAGSGRGAIRPPIGTRIAPRVKKATLYEGNRFYYEGFIDNEEAREVLAGVKRSLEQIPSFTPLERYSRSEQLAYWLNLYNITILNEIVGVYPRRDLEDFLIGEDSILSKKILRVSGIPLSLNDIQFKILLENYDNDPLVIYGLYQGIIGGPNIRKRAYSGATVYRDLEDNAIEFINSNRGTNRVSSKYKLRRVSSLYDRCRPYFPDFNRDLLTHLSKYLEGDVNKLVKSKTHLQPVVDDWTVTDLWGTFPEVRTGIASNPASLMGAIVGTTPGDPITSGGSVGDPNSGGGTVGASADSGMTTGYIKKASRVNVELRPEVFQYLLVLNMKRLETNEKKAIVKIEELDDAQYDDSDTADRDE